MYLQTEWIASSDAQCRLYGGADGTYGMVVHTVEDALCHVLVLVADECQCSCLRQSVLLVAYLAIDGQRMIGCGVVDHADTSHAEHVVDVLDVVRHLFVGLCQLAQVLLLAVVAVSHFRHVASGTEDTQQLVVLVIDGHQLQLVVDGIRSLGWISWYAIFSGDEMELGEVHGLHVMDIDVAVADDVAHVNMGMA